MSQLTAAPSDPAVAPPARRPGSVRRTSTVLMSWPDGLGTDLHLEGRARDLLTPVDGEPSVVSEADLYAVTGPERDIRRIEADPAPGRAGAAGRQPGRRQSAQGDRGGTARGGCERHATASAARRPGRLHADFRLRLRPLARPPARNARALHQGAAQPPDGGHLLGVPVRVERFAARRLHRPQPEHRVPGVRWPIRPTHWAGTNS